MCHYPFVNSVEVFFVIKCVNWYFEKGERTTALSNNNLNPSWFGFPILINNKYLKNKQKYLNYLNLSGVETRPILSGNFLNQPSARLYGFNKKNEKFKNSQDIEDRGFFIGLPTKEISVNTLKFLTEKLLKI